MMEAQEKERFEVTDASSAEWCMERLAEKEAERRKVEEQYDKMVSRYDKWREDSLEKLESDESYLHQLLAPWVDEQLEGGKVSSIKLPSGRVGFHAGPRQFSIGGEKASATNQALLEFVKASQPEMVEVKESVKWADFKRTLTPTEDGQAVTKDGEIVPGMKVERGERKFYVEVNKDAAL